MGGQLFISDGVAMYRTTQAIVRDHTLAVQTDAELPQLVVGWDGQHYSQYDLGQPLAAIPFYIVGAAFASIFPHGDEVALTVFAVSLLPQIATAFAGLVLYQLALALFRSTRVALALALLWGTGTLALPYSKFYFSEALLTLFLLLACWQMIEARQRDSTRRLLLSGIALSAAVAVRAAAAIYYPAFIVYLLIEGKSSRAKSALVFSAGFVPALVLMLWHNHVRFHNILQTGYEGQGFTTPLPIGLLGLTISPGRSLFLYSPLVMLGAVSLCWFRARFPAMTVFILTATVSAFLFYGQWWSWHGGWSWGPRLLVPLVPFLLIPLGAQLSSRGFALVIIAFWVFSLLVVIPGVCVDFNAYFVNSLYRESLSENALWFEPRHSQIIVQWRYLLAGEAITFAGNHLSDFGLPKLANGFYLPVMGFVLLLAIARLWVVWRN
jgi:4-amino-4-deoxy-L-arabinose transferase-like glycosyltransferase